MMKYRDRKNIGVVKYVFRRFRRKVIRLWRLNFVIPKLLKYNAYTGFLGRKVFHFLPFFLPHDKSYYGFIHLVHPGDGLFLDVGANDGISAIGFRHIHSDYRILSLEPNRYHEPSLRKLKKKLKGFDYQIVAAGSEACQKVLYMPFYSGVPVHTAASVQEKFVQASMKDQFRDAGQEKIAVLQQIVEVVRIDDLKIEPDIIKIDTEGFDYQVLLGALGTIGRVRPYVVVERNKELIKDFERYFQSLSYRMFTYDYTRDLFTAHESTMSSGVRSSDNISNNLFCIPQEKVSALPVR